MPCPECGHYQPFVWANLIFDPDDLQKIVYKCERCGCVANEYRWKQQSQQGRFVAENPAQKRGGPPEHACLHLLRMEEIVQKFIVAKEQLDQGNPEGMKVWVNTELGETWEERGEQVEDTELFNSRLNLRRGGARRRCLCLPPVWMCRMTALRLRSWVGALARSWESDTKDLRRYAERTGVEDLDAFADRVVQKDGTALRIISCCIDSGGHHTDQVYRFTKERYERGVMGDQRARGGAEVPFRNPTTNNRVKTLFIIGVDANKGAVIPAVAPQHRGNSATSRERSRVR